MDLEAEVKFSVEGFLASFEKLTKETKKIVMTPSIFKTPAEKEKDLFEKVYPELEKLYYQTRAKGIMKSYVKD